MNRSPFTAHLLLLTATAHCLLLLGGCSGYRANVQASLVSVRRPVIQIGGETNRPATGPEARGADAPAVNLPVGAPVVIYAEQIYVSFWGGSAASNSVLSGIEIPLMKGVTP
jgi:hypothetical protein